MEAGIVNQRCECAVGVDAEVEVLVYKKVGAGTLADDFEHTLQNTCHGVKGYADNPEFWYMAAIALHTRNRCIIWMLIVVELVTPPELAPIVVVPIPLVVAN
jgi:hypothetical protein